ncbi:nucleoside triphosphate pyrophosphohydrolase [Desulfoscipio gibsoniae]|uniref:MazG family protein n=1 Tax=Desulfoscipio gibsoniae DSM 7213 TaxID=767817 RepID=R4KB12_9FIRM|nr:nucleoside triphosphate pyrophosphohydrolase [Desulfoscipio gibsoniae]AGK99758.1 MazG family protein [Desulfoscipio gibsoniae DSM 7213]
MTTKVIVVGLGPGSQDALPAVNLEVLKCARRLFLRTGVHPVVDWLKEQGIAFDTFDKYYEQADSFDDVYRRIAEDVLAAAGQGTVVYAVPGHPLVAETAVDMIMRKAEQRGISTEVLPAMSFLDELYAVLKVDPVQGIQIIDGLKLDGCLLNPALGVVMVQVYSRLVASDVKLSLLEMYPAEHLVAIVRAAGVPGEQRVEYVPLFEMDRLDWLDHLTSIYIPPISRAADSMKADFPLDPLVDIMGRLRGEGGCPWDREQDHHTLTPYLLEETYEVLEAIQQENMYNICEELGDLLLQIVFHAQIARENGLFDINDVVRGICQKMIHRHPHVFGNIQVNNSDEVLANWEIIKQGEKDGGAKKKESVLDGVPRGLPAMPRSYKIQAKAARVGFDWPDYRGALDKVDEELVEWKEALASGQRDRIELETGDMLFAVVNTARLTGIDPEVALTATINKFICRFKWMEKEAAVQGLNLADMTLAEMDELWEKAKNKEI